MRMNALSITKVKVKTLFWAAALAPALLAGCSTSQPQREAALQQQNPDTYARQQQNAPLTVADVKAMSKAGIAEDTIVAKIRDSHTIFHLSANDVLDLHSSGVPQSGPGLHDQHAERDLLRPSCVRPSGPASATRRRPSAAPRAGAWLRLGQWRMGLEQRVVLVRRLLALAPLPGSSLGRRLLAPVRPAGSAMAAAGAARAGRGSVHVRYYGRLRRDCQRLAHRQRFRQRHEFFNLPPQD